MRHLLLTFIFAFSNMAHAQQETTSAAEVAAAMFRGAISCSTHTANTIEGVVIDDPNKTPGIRFTFNGESNLYKLVGKSTAAGGKITIYGVLVESNNPSKSKNKMKMSEDLFQGKEYFQAVKFEGKVDTVITRCTNFREIAKLIPDLPAKK